MKKNIMIVDDSIFIRNSLRQMLTRNGFTVVAEAADGREAIDKYKNSNPDLVIMDITMPKMDGLEALESIKTYNSTARIVIMSVKSHRENIKQAVKLGAVDFITKPLEEKRVLSSVLKYLL